MGGYGGGRQELERLVLYTITTAGSGTGTSTGTNNSLSRYHHGMVVADVTFTTGTAPTLVIYLDSKLDGTTFVNLARFAAITTNGQYVAVVTKEQKVNALVGDVLADAGAGTIRNLGWGDDMRVRHSISDATSQFSARVWFVGIG